MSLAAPCLGYIIVMVTSGSRNGSQRGGSSSIVEEHPYILCGHINLHHSDACNAQLVKYVNDAMRQCVFDGNGFTAEPGYRFNRAERPVNVRQWEDRQRGDRTGAGNPQHASPQSDGSGLLQSGGGVWWGWIHRIQAHRPLLGCKRP